MPAKKTTRKEKTNVFDFQKLVNTSDSYKSLIYGIVTVVVLFIVIALGVRTLQQNKAQIDEEALQTQNQDQTQGKKYTVVAGDTLWSIAESQYNDGFKWGEIAKANNITEATSLEEGTELIIPEVSKEASPTEMAMQTSPTVTPSPTMVPSPTAVVSPTIAPAQQMMQSDRPKITGGSYTVVEGDTLWDISIRAYGNGYRWVEIAQLNALPNPDLIYVGSVMKLPRP